MRKKNSASDRDARWLRKSGGESAHLLLPTPSPSSLLSPIFFRTIPYQGAWWETSGLVDFRTFDYVRLLNVSITERSIDFAGPNTDYPECQMLFIRSFRFRLFSLSVKSLFDPKEKKKLWYPG